MECSTYFVLFGCEVVLAGKLEAVVSMQYSGHLQSCHVLYESRQLFLNKVVGLGLKLSQAHLFIPDMLPGVGPT